MLISFGNRKYLLPHKNTTSRAPNPPIVKGNIAITLETKNNRINSV